MKVAIVSDQHYGVRNNNALFLNKFNQFYDDIFFPYLKEHGITTVWNGGDSFDNRKTLNVMTLTEYSKHYLDRFAEYGIEEHALIGNHTTYYKNTNEVNSLSELYEDKPNLHLYESSPKAVNFDGTIVGFIPWICASNHDECIRFLETTNATVIIGHFEINGFYMNAGIQCENGLKPSLFDRFDMVFSGHFHKRHSIKNVHYVGTPYQMTFADVDEPKGFHVFDTETKELEFIENPNHMFYRIYYDDENYSLDVEDYSVKTLDNQFKDCYIKIVVMKKTDPALFDSFLDTIESHGPANVQIIEQFLEDLVEEDVAINMGLPTIEIIKNHIDESDSIVDKNELKQIMAKVHIEAINM